MYREVLNMLKVIFGFLMDISAAFDNSYWPLIHRKLKKYLNGFEWCRDGQTIRVMDAIRLSYFIE